MMTEGEEIETPNQAFASAITPKTLGDIELRPFSLLRKNVAYQLGITGEPENLFFDAVIVAWLMSMTDPEVAGALKDKKKAIVDAFAWAEKRGLDKDNYKPLVSLLVRIMAELDRSTDIEANGDQDSKNAGGPPTI
jgi:hypothetical protein